jgi:hypothetical protein
MLARCALVLLLVLASCGKRTPASVSLNKTEFRRGEAIQIRIGNLPSVWSGELIVNQSHRLRIKSTSQSFYVTAQNGFVDSGPADLVLALKDGNGREIPVNPSHTLIKVAAPDVAVHPDSTTAGAFGGSGRVYVAAPAGHAWSATGVPDWIHFDGALHGIADANLDYTVAENDTNSERRAQITIGDASFRIVQERPAFIFVPYFENFVVPPPPNWALNASAAPGADFPTRWVLDDQASQPADTSITAEGPGGAHSLVITKKQADQESWRTQIYLPSIQIKTGQRYRVSVWLKAQKPATVGVAFEQRTDPYHICGLDRRVTVSPQWTQYSFPFEAEGERCEAENNRLAIEAGNVSGKVWISKLAFTTLSVSVSPESSDVASGGGAGVIHVDAPAGYSWTVSGAPDWVQVSSGGKGAGKSSVDYKVAANSSGELRSAVLNIGDAPFQISQGRGAGVALPYADNFNAPPPAIWEVDRNGFVSGAEPPSRWVLDDQSGQHAVSGVTLEGPGGSNSLWIQKPNAAKEAWMTQIHLIGLQTDNGAKYKLSVWLKAQQAGPVSLVFGQKTDPYSSCGLDQTVPVTNVWKEFTFSFTAAGNACGERNNRLSIAAGKIAGRVWLSKFSMTPAR